MYPALTRLILYTKQTEHMIAFYQTLFGYTPHRLPGDRIVELRPPGAGMILMLHPAAKSQKQGQAQTKLVFDIADVDGFITQAADQGSPLGPVHKADGYRYSNTKDPSGNTVQVTSRAFAPNAPS